MTKEPPCPWRQGCCGLIKYFKVFKILIIGFQGAWGARQGSLQLQGSHDWYASRQTGSKDFGHEEDNGINKVHIEV